MQKSAYSIPLNSMAPCVKRTTGISIELIKKEIRCIAIKQPKIVSLWGFGSAFRSHRYNDIDLLAIFDSKEPEAFRQYIQFLSAIGTLSARLGVLIDITALTVQEAAANPLRESGKLVPLYHRDCASAEYSSLPSG
jgi:predicted nucleotidyltransferase